MPKAGNSHSLAVPLPSVQEYAMGNVDKMKGRAKEALGRLVGDRSLEREGKADRTAGKLKDAVSKVKDTMTGRGRRYR
jgi:uncharacterized protein YjbJ (UPF0337 family)